MLARILRPVGFLLGTVAILLFLGGVLLVVGRLYPGSSAEVIDWRPTRSPEVEVQNEIDDVRQMLEAQNERRRRRGLPDRTIEEVEQQVAAELREQARRLREHQAAREADGEELAQLMLLANERRRRRGEPQLTIEQYRAQLQDGPPG